MIGLCRWSFMMVAVLNYRTDDHINHKLRQVSALITDSLYF